MKNARNGSWTPDDIPDLSGKTALVTGGNSGLGFHTAQHLAARGAHVLVASRNEERGRIALQQLREAAPGRTFDFVRLDLADLEQIAAAADNLAASLDRLDILVNNAGVMAPPRSETRQGHELQFGVNHLGHFALTALLYPLMARTAEYRVVNVSSSAAYYATIKWDDPGSQKRYRRYMAYGQSKLANVLFALELDRRVKQAGNNGQASAAHPGFARTNLQKTTVAASGSFLERLVYGYVMSRFAQSAEEGAWPQLRAATDPSAEGGEFWGPQRKGRTGPPVTVELPKGALQEGAGERLWTLSEELTGISFRLGSDVSGARLNEA